MAVIGKALCTWDYYDPEWGSTECREDRVYDVYEHDEANGTYTVQTKDGWMTISEQEFEDHFEMV